MGGGDLRVAGAQAVQHSAWIRRAVPVLVREHPVGQSGGSVCRRLDRAVADPRFGPGGIGLFRRVGQADFRKALANRMARMLRKLANHCRTGVYAAEKTENGHEIGCVRGGSIHHGGLELLQSVAVLRYEERKAR